MAMKTRKQRIESIAEGMYAIRRKFMTQGLTGAKKSGKFCHHAKGDKHHITPSQWAVLAIVTKKEDISIKELGKCLGITSSAATQLVDELVNKEYLVRENNTRDRRALSLRLSDQHKKRMADMKARNLQRFTAMFNVLTDKELAQYAALSKKITDGVPQ